MSGVRAAQGLALDRATPGMDADAMQDVLYDILATGMDTEQVDAPTEQIERFLFEHARSPKSGSEFEAFFAQHGLTVRRGSAPAADTGFALPPLEPPPVDESAAVLALAGEDDLGVDEARTGQHSTFSQPGVAAPRPWAMRMMGAALLVLCLGLAAIAWVGHGIIQELRGDLDRAEVRGAQQEQVIDQLEGRAAGIQSSIEANGQLIHRMEQKSDLLIDSLVKPEPPKPKKRWQRRH